MTFTGSSYRFVSRRLAGVGAGPRGAALRVVGLWFLAAFGGVGGLVGSAQAFAQGDDGALEPKQRFDGRIATTSDVDSLTYDAIEGTELSIVVAAKDDSKVAPRARLLMGGQELVPDLEIVTNGGREHRLLRYPIAASAPLTIEVRGAASSLGDYRLKVRERVPAKRTWHATIAAGGTQVVTFAARAGTSALLQVERKSKGTIPLVPPKLLTPEGSEMPLDGALVAQVDEFDVGPIELLEDGVYSIELGAAPASSEKLVARVVLTPPEVDASTVTEALGAAGAAGSLFLEGGDWLPSEADDGEFVADELLVSVREQGDAARVADRLGLDVAAADATGLVLLRTRGATTARRAASPANAADRARVRELCQRARGEPGVRFAEPNHLRSALALPTDPLFPLQWDYHVAGFERAAELTPGDATRTIAVLDTGVRFEHPDLAGRFVTGYDFVSDSWNAADGNGLDSDPTDPVLSQGTHGTHVSGTIAAATDNSIGIAGAIRSGRILPLRVLGILGGTDFDIAQAIRYAARLPNNSGTLPPQRAEVINMSLGGPSPSMALAQAVAQAIAAGVVVVAAAGNANSKTPMYPAAIDGVIAVAATDRLDGKAFYSSFGKHVSLAAPGGDPYVDADDDGFLDGILSTVIDPYAGPTYSNKAGTSMAAPHVAAAAFLLRSVAPSLTPVQVEACLCASALDLGAPGFDKFFGYGRLDAGRSIDDLLGTSAAPKDLFALPSTLSFDADVDERELALVNVGGGPAVEILGASSPAFYVEVGGAVGPLPRTLTVAVDRQALLPGAYSTTIVLDTSIGSRSIPVVVTVPETGSPPLVPRVYVIAYDLATHAVAGTAVVENTDGGDFEFGALPEGTYRFLAATDLDLDGLAGEDHDFAGVAIDPSTAEPSFALADGSSLPALVLMLHVGGASGNKSLPVVIDG